jgi:chemotaxis methyl-accepting protein methylase
MAIKVETILKYLHDTRGFDFSKNRYSSLERKITARIDLLGISTAQGYIRHLDSHPEEWPALIDLLTIHVSRFFRNTLTFEMLAQQILPGILALKRKEPSPYLRIWSAGCACGEEPYSTAIIIHDLLKKEPFNLDLNIFATDINQTALEKAREAIYQTDQLLNVQLKYLQTHFRQNNGRYHLKKKIKEMVNFSFYDIIDAKTYVPPESVYGDFDMVLCRNLLIYFHRENQKIVFNKLVRALSSGGYLIIGEAERLPVEYQDDFILNNEFCHIYRKIC